MTHSTVGPSGAARRIQCPASVRLQQQFPEREDSSSAIEGTQAHLVASELLQGRPHDAPYVTDEMRLGAEMYVQAVRRHCPSGGAVETRVSIPNVHADAFGTPDFFAWLPSAPRRTLLLVDYKFGHGSVEVFNNPQLVDYVSGCLSEVGASDLDVDVICVIVQPRSFHRDGPVREWRFRASETRALVNISNNAAHEALGPSPRARVGPECLHCSAAHGCTTLQQAAYRVADLAYSAPPAEMTPANLSAELALLAQASTLLEARRSAAQTQAEWHMGQGRTVPGWALERGAGRQKWARGDAAVIALGQAMGFGLAQPAKALTPAQARQLGFPVDQIAGIVTRTPGEAKLVPATGSAADRIFGTIVKETLDGNKAVV